MAQDRLKLLGDKLKPFEQEKWTLPTSVIETIEKCEAGLRGLDKELQKHGRNTISNRIAYPFIKDSLTLANAMLDSLQNNLTLALHNFSVDTYEHVIELSQTTSQYKTETMQKLDCLTTMVAANNDNTQGACIKPEPFQNKNLSLNPKRKPRNKVSRPSIILDACPCRRAEYTSEWDIIFHTGYPILSYLFWQQVSDHRRDSPWYKSGHRTVVVEAKFLPYNELLRYSVAIALSVTRGAGSFSISPHLNMSYVVPHYAPSFEIFCGHEPNYKSSSWTCSGKINWMPAKVLPEPVLNLQLTKLRLMFHQRKAGANDITVGGLTLFAGLRNFFYQSRLPEKLDISEFYDTAETLCDLGSRIDLTNLHLYDDNGFGSAQRKIEHFIYKTKQADGIELLLKAEADVNKLDRHMRPPISYAVRAKCMPSIRMLLANDSMLGECESPVFTMRIEPYEDMDILKIVSAGVVNRRQRLYELAMSACQEMQIDIPSYLENSKILDAFAWKVTRLLLDHGVSVQPALLPCLVMASWSIYHAEYLSREAAEYLYQAGFKNINEYDDYAYTPCMRCI
ncbi:7147d7d6-64a7-4c41-a492-8ba1142a58f6 [Sclerotinia trifoliorum]|uniref:7147d7d6-64a7-4c41-a492-8ba1142a58f6 n=1 Tax=Sclerotinia trifoliorum TaxID=28548 RepID=A0A8H2W7L0_9HELO|nr:7147d7d6-64a7-4c41-a492-8ba1142a58f6 [Sclerotinia trifoliorum]